MKNGIMRQKGSRLIITAHGWRGVGNTEVMSAPKEAQL